ncbi:hydantoinase/oxoprolinase family protein [Pseudonocardia hispaniensis]|uniref:Hydantoinase/oxoprolinase family protein n=1 Tax=Pseudonocardia hispaniensis TaxID=904933 RepID=A0ABW1J4J5_9PSEU
MRVATDIGGTFTDLACVTDTGELRLEKSSSTPGQFEVGVDDVLGKTGIARGDGIEAFVHGTTVVINALLERTGTVTALLTTAGFRDVLEIGRASRPDLYNFRYRKPEPFVPRYLRFDVRERCDETGAELEPLSVADCESAVAAARAAGAKAVAICFLHAYANPDHERRCAEVVRQLWPEAFVTMSHECTQEWREYERSNTAVLNAYVQETASTYLDRLERRLDKRGIRRSLFVMQSNGGMVSFPHARELPIKLVESGPAAGVIAAATLGERSGRPNVITLDIGGTTAKTSLIENGAVRLTTDYHVDWAPDRAGYPIKTPVVDIVEIGAGGGSIAWVGDPARLGLGPRSAGAVPGPACYPDGGAEPTLTDANLVAGRINPDYFLGGQMTVSVERARQALQTVAGPLGMSVEDAALGIIRLANAKMLNAIKLVSVRRGYDPRDFYLMAFGGGGPLHAVALGSELRVRGVIIPPAPGNFSAVGMLLTNLRADWVRTRLLPVAEESASAIGEVWDGLDAQARAYFAREGVAADALTLVRSADMRYAGQEHTVNVPIAQGQASAEILERFHELHERSYTFRLGAPAQFVNFHLTALGPAQRELFTPAPTSDTDQRGAPTHRPVLFDGLGTVPTAIHRRAALPPGTVISGPAVIEEAGSSTVAHPGQTVTVDDWGNLVIEWHGRKEEA